MTEDGVSSVAPAPGDVPKTAARGKGSRKTKPGVATGEEDGEEDESVLFSSAEGRDRAVELASSVLSSFFASTAEEEEKP